MQPPPQLTVEWERLLERVHSNLYAIVGEEVDRIFHLERGWSKAEVTKRVVRYVYNAAKSPELLSLHWQEAARKLVEQAMRGYAGGCQERHWFFELDLAPALASAAWELARATGQARCVQGSRLAARFREVQELVTKEYEDKLDLALLTKAMWDATEATFQDSAVRTKVHRALFKTHAKALEECLVDSRPLEDLKRVEQFTRRWIDSSMGQVWSCFESPELVLTERTVLRLFQNLVSPFGDRHPYSCIPPVLIDRIGRPPSDWEYLGIAVEQMLTTWRHEALQAPGGAKRRRTRNGCAPAADGSGTFAGPWGHSQASRIKALAALADEGPIEVVASDEEPERAMAQEARAEQPGAAAEEEEAPPEGHRECTSAEDCVGRPGELLVRHILDGLEGDIYCETCWRGFRSQNPTFEGVWEDGPWAGKACTGSAGQPAAP